MAKVASLAVQKTAMKLRWPEFKVEHRFVEKSVQWVGRLTGIERTFVVSIRYGLPHRGRNEDFRFSPIVQVLEPALQPNPNAFEEAPLPHVYPDFDNLPLSPLCLFDPRKGEWNSRKLIACTTVPWTERWLWYYEIWEATGRWHGGGSHPETEDLKSCA